MTRAEPGGTLEQNSWRSSKQASARGTSKRMSLDAYSIIFCTRAEHAGDWISSLRRHTRLSHDYCRRCVLSFVKSTQGVVQQIRCTLPI